MPKSHAKYSPLGGEGRDDRHDEGGHHQALVPRVLRRLDDVDDLGLEGRRVLGVSSPEHPGGASKCCSETGWMLNTSLGNVWGSPPPATTLSSLLSIMLTTMLTTMLPNILITPSSRHPWPWAPPWPWPRPLPAAPAPNPARAPRGPPTPPSCRGPGHPGHHATAIM